jgi:hypothetical protein
MQEFIIIIILCIPELLKYSGNLLLRSIGYDVDLGKDSFAAYSCGSGLMFLVVFLIGLVIKVTH